MKAVVLVGGEGTRLRPLTYTVPKQMLSVAGRTVIERVLAQLSRHGVDEVVLSLGYKPDAFLAAYPDGRCGDVLLHYAVEDSPLDTAGAIAFAARKAGLGQGTFIVVNGDVLTDFDISALVAFHTDRGAEGTVALTPVDDPSRFGVVPVDDRGQVEAFIEKPPPGTAPTNMINAGIYVFKPAVLDRIEPGRRVSVEREVFPAMVADRVLYALGSDAPWLDMGTVEKYIYANIMLARSEGFLDVTERQPGVHPGAQVSDSVLEYDVYVAAGAKVAGSVLLSGSRVGEGAVVLDSVLGPGAIVGEGAAVHAHSVLGDGWVVDRGQVLTGARLPA
jgi:mannose-1-phosphate guanylyltransferase